MAVSFSSQAVLSGLSNPTSLQFGPDGRLYVAQQDGLIRVYDVTQPSPGQWTAAEAQTIGLIRSLPNHDDDGSLNASITDRQVTGLLVAGTAANPVLYVTSSDPRIGNFSDLGLDTNSGILSRLAWTGSDWLKVDLIRGLPRSEENHSPNGMVLSADGGKLYLAQGGNTNNGAPSHFFSNTAEYAVDAAVLEIDLAALEAMPDRSFTYANGVTSTYRYDLPTLDDPTVLNNGATGNETAGGLDVGGPFGGNDGLNQAVLPPGAPLRIFATGLRNAYDLVLSEAGKLFTIDNGANDGLGGTPILDAQGRPTNQFNNGGVGSVDFLYQLSDGTYYGHPNPSRGNQTGAIYAYSDGDQPQVNATIANAAAAVPASLQIAAGYLIDPSRFTASATRLSQEGLFSAGQQALAQFAASTNGLMEYTSDAFGGEIQGDLIAASFDGTLRLVQMAADGVTVQGVTTLATPGGTPLDLVQGPDGTIWVAQIGAGQVVVLSPSAQATAADPDLDDDGLPNTVDPFQTDAANGFGTYLASNASLAWNFQFGAGNSAPGPSGLFLGLTGHMVNGTRDHVAPVAEGGLDLANVKVGTAAGGGLVVIEEVSSGTASGSANTGEFVFQTGVALAPDVQTFTVKWTAINPYPALLAAPTVREIGGFIGTGEQSNFLKVVASPSGFLFQLENNNSVVASQSLSAPAVATAPVDSSLVFELLVNRATSQAIPSVTYASSGGPVKVTGTPIALAGTAVLSAINGAYEVQGKDTGLAVGLWSSNTGEGSQNTFQVSFDDILITTTGPATQLVKAVNVGGGQVTASNGVVFQADPGPTTGAAASQVFTTTAGIAGTTDDALYQDERWTPGGSYAYEIPVANGTYTVDLLFAEIYSGIHGSGQRVFDMSLEGQALAALQDIDIYAKVGLDAAYTVTQSVTVSDGSLSIQVGPGSSSPGNVENAKLNAFAVYGAGGGSTPSPSLAIAAASASQNEGDSGTTPFTFTVTRTGNTTVSSTVAWAVTGSGATPASAADFAGGAFPTGTVSFAPGETGKTITVNLAGDTAVESNESFAVTLSNPSAGTTVTTASATGIIQNDDAGVTPTLVTAINVGGGEVAASTGVVFQADPGPTTGAAASQVFTTTAGIAGTTDDALYQDERWTPGGSYAYEIPVANGTYTVDLLFAEIYSGIHGSGQRVFDMSLEGQALAALQDIDIYAKVGLDAAYTVTQSVTVSDGSLSIQVGPGSSSPGNVENAKLNAFAVYGSSTTPPPAPTLSIATANASLNEGNSGGTAYTFTVSRAGDTSGTSTAAWAVTGTGANPAGATDFSGGTFPTGTVSFGVGETTKTITVNVAGDTAVEANESFLVSLQNPSSGTLLGTAVSATGTILNDDTAPVPSLSVAATNASLNEGNTGTTAFTFTVTRAGDTTGSSTASYAVTGSGANPTSANDFAGGAFSTGTVSFAAGETSKVITVSIAADTVVEPNEGFTLTLSNPSSGTTLGTASATGTILNDDSSGAQALVKAVNVGGGQVTASTGVVFQADPGPATGAAASQVFVTTAGIAGTTDDALYQDERWTPGGSYAYEIPVANGTYTVDLLFAEIYSGIHGSGQRVFDMSLEGQALAALQDIDIYAKVGLDAAYTVTQSVTVSDGSLSIQVGPGSSSPGNVENAKLNAFAVYGAPPTTPTATVSLATASVSLNEGNASSTAFTYTATRSGDTSGSSTVAWAVAGSGANPASDTDFTGGKLPSGTLNFAAGETSKTITVSVAGDSVVESAEGFSLTLSNPGSGTALGTATATGIILNDDTPPGPSLSIAATNASLNEGNSGTTAFTFTVSRTGDTTGSSTASYAVTGSGATPASASDFAGGAFPTGTVSFAAGESSKVITVDVGGDATIESDETFAVTLSNPSAGTSLGTASASSTILNDDGSVTQTLVKAVNVGGGQVMASTGVVFQADPGPTTGAAASQVFTTTAGIAGTTDDALYQDERWTPGGSYAYEIPVANGTYTVDLLFAEIYSGIHGSGQRVFDMSLEGQALAALQDIDIYAKVGLDAAYTVTQSVTVSDGSLSIQVGPGSSSPGNVENAKLNAFAVYGASTTPPPAAASLSIAATNASLNEGNSGSTPFTFTVNRSGDTAGSSTAAWAVTGSGANPAGATDFAGGAFPTGTLSFAAGEASKTITIDVAGDIAVEASESFAVTLSDPGTGTTLGTASATGTILNDDSAGSTAAAKLLITPDTALNASTYGFPAYELTNTGTMAIRTLTIDLRDALVAGTVFDPFGTFGDTTALDLSPYGSVPVSASWLYGPTPVTEGGYKTLAVTFGGDGLAAGQTFAFRLDADPASIDGPSPGPNEAGSISGFEHVGASVGVGLVDGSALQAEVFTQGSAGGGLATLLASPAAPPVLSLSTVAGVPLATDAVGGIVKANLPGLNDLAGTPGNDIVVNVTGVAGQTVRLAVAELGGVGTDIPLGSHEGNTVLQAPSFVDVTLGAAGSASVALALPAETPIAGLAPGSVSGRFAVTAAAIDPASGTAISEVSATLAVKDAPNSFTSEAASDTFLFRQGFAATDIYQFAATGPNHDFVGLDQALFPGQTIQQVLDSNALRPGAAAGDVDIVPASGNAIHLHDASGQLTVEVLRASPGDFFFV